MSGIVLPLKQNGYVEVMFDDHTIQHSSDVDIAEKKTIGLGVISKKFQQKLLHYDKLKYRVLYLLWLAVLPLQRGSKLGIIVICNG